MQDSAGFESFTPGEGQTSGQEQLSEKAKERFQEASKQIKQIIREEKKAKKRDDRVARTIVQFLGEKKYAHLMELIARLVGRDCPSIYILTLLSLIHEGCLEAVQEYIAEHNLTIEAPKNLMSLSDDGLPSEAKSDLVLWIERQQLVLSLDGERILIRLMVDENNIDGAVLQLTTFILVEYFATLGKPVPYEELQPLTIRILQDVIEPHIGIIETHFQALRDAAEPKDEDE